jgi:CBS domain-containing protein
LLLGPDSVLQMVPTGAPVYHSAMLGALVLGIVGALVAAGLSKSVHFFESMFEHLPIHWMWWPAIGGVVVGLCGYIFPESLGIGHSVLQQLISGDAGWKLLAGILVLKSLSWSFSLGSNTAGGILSPLLMIGGALGAALGHLMPLMSTGAWVLVGMCAVLSAAIGAPLTSAMLALELTHNGGLMLPVLLSCVAAYAVSVLVMPRSMLTENLSRRGLHLSREFGADPLEAILVSQAMHTSVFALPEDATRKDAADWLRKMDERGGEAWSHWQRLFPLVDSEGRLTGTLTRAQLIAAARKEDLSTLLAVDANRNPKTVSPVTTLRACAMSMAESKLTSYPVVSADGKLLGVMTITDLLKGRSEEAHRESDRERVLRLRWPFRPSNSAKSSVIQAERVTDDPSQEEVGKSD